MKDVLKFAIFHDKEDNIEFLQSVHEHAPVEEEEEWKVGGFQNPFGQYWQATIMSYKNLKLLNEENDEVARAFGGDFFMNRFDQKYCLELMRHMISHLKKFHIKMSRMYKVILQ
ncbi:hypothetical protein LIER_17930 [Lithospermum erythrorhizon]|uniref:Uncharacterized protein n=1 Tax=Lithospermum erythrorhizon TaxID=34254 RepID=A0AAV3QCC2_LITER